jgi:hypothetical protein
LLQKLNHVNTVFLFEDVSTEPREVVGSPQTVRRSEQDLLKDFSGYEVKKRGIHVLHTDTILALHLEKPGERSDAVNCV